MTEPILHGRLPVGADAAIAAQGSHGLDGAVLDGEAFALRYGAPDPADERLLVVNLGRDLVAPSFAEPLMAPPDGMHWGGALVVGGAGVRRQRAPPIESDEGWRIPGHAAVLLAPAGGVTWRPTDGGTP